VSGPQRPQRPQRVAITGATGLIGLALVQSLRADGHAVQRLVRPGSQAPAEPNDLHWDPEKGVVDAKALDGIDAVVHLAGEPIAERWTAEHKQRVRDSRVTGTAVLSTALAGLTRPPRVMLSASAMGYYGDGEARRLDEASPAGDGFLASVAVEWEAAATPAADAGIRVVHPRFGVVLSPDGGMLERLLTPFRLGAGGKLGNGTQWLSWIALDDAVRALRFLLALESEQGDVRAADIRGPVNLTAPNPVTNADFSHTLAHVLGRPALATVPAFALRLMFGEMADAMLLAGQRVMPTRLLASGFTFSWPELDGALRAMLSKDGSGASDK